MSLNPGFALGSLLAFTAFALEVCAALTVQPSGGGRILVRGGCTYELNGRVLNACKALEPRLAGEEGLIIDEMDGARQGTRYALVADRPVGQTSIDASSNCHEDDWVCVSSTSGAGSRVKVRLGTPWLLHREKQHARLSFQGTQDDVSPLSEINLHCSSTHENVRYTGQGRGVASFEWHTPLACSLCASEQPQDDVVAISQEDTTPPPDGSDTKPDDTEDLMPDNPKWTRQRVALIFISIVFLLASTYSLIAFPRLRHSLSKPLSYTAVPVLSAASSIIRPVTRRIGNLTPKVVGRLLPFRQDGSQLVRWAEEDMGVFALEEVIPGPAEYDDWVGDGAGEYIPLTIGSSRGRTTRSYGATPDVETFAERGLASRGLAKIFGK